MTHLKNLKTYPIDLIFVSSYYDKILFTHPKKIKLIILFMLHILLLVVLYLAPFIYDTYHFNLFYICLIIAMICGWITFNGECWINLWEKKILNSQYKSGDNLDVNPSIDYITSGIITKLNKNKSVINDDAYIYYKHMRYKLPLLIPFISFTLFIITRFKNVKMSYKITSIIIFIILLVITHFKWKSIDKFYK
jgi:hypothetical protein